MKRLSVVDDVYILAISSASALHVGDNKVIRLRNRVFAVQRKIADFWGNEGNFADPLFSDPIPQPAFAGDVTMSVDNLGSIITVGRVKILAISASSAMQVGSTELLDAEARIKNIRHFITSPGEGGGEAAAAGLEGGDGSAAK